MGNYSSETKKATTKFKKRQCKENDQWRQKRQLLNHKIMSTDYTSAGTTSVTSNS
jgi:hypothetical protein